MSKKTGKRTCRLDGDKLTLTVNGKTTVYTVTNVNPDPAVAYPAFALQKEDGTVHHVFVDQWGARCECEDAHYRSKVCKHLSAMRACGLIPKED